ncbi:MAG: succinate dehydrogenase, hydrophobic membrane anchor protein [Rubellimicrobium sp.]|nr:succinate dehydrogenase, hydrophobic membrane anchor protein [Rubellimicrobium sp.]
MRYLTDRKRAERLGSARRGTEAHWAQTISAVALALMMPTWLVVFGRALGGSRDSVLATFAQPFPAILTALVLVVAMRHFARGMVNMIDDYARGTARKIGIMAAYFIAGGIGATGIFAILKIAL